MKKNNMCGFRFLRFILAPIFKLYYNPTIIGKENIPKEGSILIVGNHKHLMDQCLAIISTKRVIHYMAKKEYFDGKFAWFFKLAGCISVNRSIKDTDASNKALELLKLGYAVGIFPEGTRNRTKEKLSSHYIPFSADIQEETPHFPQKIFRILRLLKISSKIMMNLYFRHFPFT